MVRRLALILIALTVALPAHAAVNAAPELASIGNRTVAEGQALALTITASDTDGDALTFFGPVLPPGASFNAGTGVVEWIPTFTQSGVYPGLTFTVSDGKDFDTETIAITVTDVNRAPIAASGGPYTGTAGTATAFNATGSTDPDGTTLSVSWNFGDGTSAPGGVTTHVYATPGTYPVTVTVSDGVNSATASSTATITAVPLPAIPTAVTALSLYPGTVTVTSDDDFSFVVWATMPSGIASNVTNASIFSSNDPRGGISGAHYFPGKVGTWDVTATFGGLTATSQVTVLPGHIAHIIVNPSSNSEAVAAGTTVTFSAQTFDADWNLLGNAVTWSVTGGSGTVSPDGIFSAATPGSGTVVASVGGISGSSPVTVTTENPRLASTPTRNPRISEVAASTVAPGVVGIRENEIHQGVVQGSEDQEIAAAPNTAPVTNSAASCSTIAWWSWLAILAAYLAILYFVLYATRRLRGGTFWVLPAALTVALLWAYFRYRCGPAYPWFPWFTVIGGLFIALFRPLPPEPGAPPPPTAQPAT